jgi:hypothetical protein
VAVIIMNRFVIKPVLAPPTKHNQLVGDPVPTPSNAPDQQHKRQKDQGLPSGIKYRILYDRTNNVQMVGLDHVSTGTHHITVRADNTPYPIRRSAMPSVRSTNLNSELEVNRGTG